MTDCRAGNGGRAGSVLSGCEAWRQRQPYTGKQRRHDETDLSRNHSFERVVSRQSDGTFRCFIPGEIPSGYSLVIHHRNLLAILPRYSAFKRMVTAWEFP